MTTKVIKTIIQIRRDTTENWLLNKDVIPAAGEPCLDITTGYVRYGDGVTTYENLPCFPADLATVRATVEALSGTGDGSIDQKIADALAAFKEEVTDNGAIDTYKELVEYVQAHGTEVTEITNNIAALQELVGDTSVQDQIQAAVDEAILESGNSLIDIVKMGGTALPIIEKTVDIPVASETSYGVVKSSTGDNHVSVGEDGTMTVVSVSMNSLTQAEDDVFVINGGSAAD